MFTLILLAVVLFFLLAYAPDSFLENLMYAGIAFALAALILVAFGVKQ